MYQIHKLFLTLITWWFQHTDLFQNEVMPLLDGALHLYVTHLCFWLVIFQFCILSFLVKLIDLDGQWCVANNVWVGKQIVKTFKHQTERCSCVVMVGTADLNVMPSEVNRHTIKWAIPLFILERLISSILTIYQ